MFFSRHINYFMKVIETGSVMKAAEVLFITPSAVRNSLTVLESYYGEKLFIRQKRGLSLTAAGKKLYEELLPTYQSVLNLMNRHGIKKQRETPLKIHMDGFYYPDIPKKVNSVMNHFNKKIELIQSSCSCLEELKNNDCDLAIYSSFEDSSDPPHDFYKIHVSQEKLGILLSRNLLSEYGSVYESIVNTKLIQRSCLLSLPLYYKLENKIKSDGVTVDFIGMPEFADVLSLIQEGVGVCLTPESILDFLPMNKNNLVFINDPFSFPLIISRDILFRNGDFDNLIEIANFIVEQGNLVGENSNNCPR